MAALSCTAFHEALPELVGRVNLALNGRSVGLVYASYDLRVFNIDLVAMDRDVCEGRLDLFVCQFQFCCDFGG